MIRHCVAMAACLLASPAHAVLNTESQGDLPPTTFTLNIEVLPQVCKESIVLPVMYFAWWLDKHRPFIRGLDFNNLQHTLVVGVQPKMELCIHEIKAKIKMQKGGL